MAKSGYGNWLVCLSTAKAGDMEYRELCNISEDV